MSAPEGRHSARPAAAAARAGQGADQPPGLLAIDHVAIAVRDLDAAVATYGEAFGATAVHRETVAHDAVEEVLLAVGESYVQLLSPTAPSSPVARFLERRGEGLHHVAYRVASCAGSLAAAVASGMTAIDAAPRPGSRGTTVAFLHPKTASGTLVELVEEAAGGAGTLGPARGGASRGGSGGRGDRSERGA